MNRVQSILSMHCILLGHGFFFQALKPSLTQTELCSSPEVRGRNDLKGFSDAIQV